MRVGELRRAWCNLLIVAVLCAGAPGALGCPEMLKEVGRWIAPRAFATASEPARVTTKLSVDHHNLLRRSRDRSLTSAERHEIQRQYAKPLYKPVWQRATVLASWGFAGMLGFQAAEGFWQNPAALLTTAVLVPASLWLADLGGQIFHKWLDSYASERNPIWGATTRDFRIHHEVPDNLNQEDYLSNVSPAAVMVLPFLAGAAALQMGPEMATAVNVFIMSILHTTEFHKQAHMKKPAPMFKFLQKIHLSLDPKEHRRHHEPPFDTEFSVFLGWSNGVSRRLDLWKRMDRVFWRFTGKMPHNWIQDPRSIPPEVVKAIAENHALLKSDDLQDLNTYANTYKGRTNPEFRAMLESAHQKWQKDFVAKRQLMFQEEAITDPERAEQEWEEEQREFPWLYGDEVRGLW